MVGRTRWTAAIAMAGAVGIAAFAMIGPAPLGVEASTVAAVAGDGDTDRLQDQDRLHDQHLGGAQDTDQDRLRDRDGTAMALAREQSRLDSLAQDPAAEPVQTRTRAQVQTQEEAQARAQEPAKTQEQAQVRTQERARDREQTEARDGVELDVQTRTQAQAQTQAQVQQNGALQDGTGAAPRPGPSR